MNNTNRILRSVLATAVMVLAFVGMGISAQSSASELGTIWDVSRLVRGNGNAIYLNDSRGRTQKVVSRHQIRTINTVFNDLLEASELKSRLLIVEGSAPNAFAGPVDGQPTVGINFAMLDLVDNDRGEWAAILGHELAHLKLDHSQKTLLRKLPLQILGAYVRHETDHYKTIRDVDLALQLFDTKFSRDQERQSDYLGVIWAVETGYGAEGAPRLHEKLFRLYGNTGIPFLNSHPSSTERVRTLTGLANRLSTTRD